MLVSCTLKLNFTYKNTDRPIQLLVKKYNHYIRDVHIYIFEAVSNFHEIKTVNMQEALRITVSLQVFETQDFQNLSWVSKTKAKTNYKK